MTPAVALTLAGHAPLSAHLDAFARMTHPQRQRAGREMAIEMEEEGYPVRGRKRRYPLPGGGHCHLTVFGPKVPKTDPEPPEAA